MKNAPHQLDATINELETAIRFQHGLDSVQGRITATKFMGMLNNIRKIKAEQVARNEQAAKAAEAFTAAVKDLDQKFEEAVSHRESDRPFGYNNDKQIANMYGKK